jgi:hypothetical protein
MPRPLSGAAADPLAVCQGREAERTIAARCHQAAPSRARMASPSAAQSPRFFRSRRRTLGPSIEDVQPTCQRSAPGFRAEYRARLGRARRVSCATSLHPLSPARRSPLRLSLSEATREKRDLDAPGPPKMAGLAAATVSEPHAAAPAHRVTGGRGRHEQGAPSADESANAPLAHCCASPPRFTPEPRGHRS